MSRDTERRALELFDEICDLDASEQAAILDERCADDPELRSTVERMLDQDPRRTSASGLAVGAGAALISRELAATPAAMPGRVGRYRIIREIGRGGMGVVYEAEQDEPARRVAVKVIREAASTEETRRRFRREVQLLGQLQHPCIASVFEAGTARIDGELVPFFAMEFVEGDPLDVHIRARQLEQHEIILLFERLCDGIQHAHQKGVIHRDLKPSNILIREDGTTIATGASGTITGKVGQPKILDFGVARFADPTTHEGTLQTHSGQLVGTLEYMSPEQLRGDPSAIDTRSDVYAIGVMLYRALSGRKPLDLSGKPVAEAARIVEEVEPEPLGAVDHDLRGDLEIIVAKALEKEPERRYASAAALAEDLHRYRTNAPITARPPSTAYQLAKFAARNRTLVGGIAATIIALVAGLVGMGMLLLESNRQRDRAEMEAERSGRIAELMTTMVAGIDPSVALGRDTTMLREILERAAASLDDLEELPSVEATMHETIGDTLLKIAAYEEAEAHLARAMELRRSLGDPVATARCGVLLGRLRASQGAHDEAAALFREHGATLSAELGDAHVEPLAVAAERADALGALSLLDEASGLYDTVLADLRRVAPGAPELAGALHGSAMILAEAGDMPAAEARLLEAIEIYENALDPEHPSIAKSRIDLGLFFYEQARFEEAERTLAPALEVADRVLGEDHPGTVQGWNNLGMVRWRLGDRTGAKAIAGTVLERRRRAYGDEHPVTADAMNNLAFVTFNTGDVKAAEQIYRDLLELRIRIFGGERHADVAHSYGEIAWVLLRRDEVDEAAAMYERALELRLEIHPDNWSVSYMRTWLGECRRRQGRLDEAEAILRQAVAGYESALGPDHFRTAAARTRLGECLLDLERPAEAVGLFRSAHRIFLDLRGPEDASTVKVTGLIERAETEAGGG